MPSIRADIIQVHPFRVRDGRLEHLVLRRSDHDELLPGAWQVVTGGVHSGETAAEAAVREVMEETGLAPLRWSITGRVASFYFAPYDAVVLSPVIACEIDPIAEPLLSIEHVEHRWLVAADARTLLAFPSQRDGVDIVEELVRGSS
jgi:dihydroneopterin triphosphate diphosphatase